ncbi:hypothetical protein G1L01_11430 [Tenacibaculum finnmarkense]|uniref:hypothetical protein n=1 Tax=Tenacibaculum finnmarkense TaxID=2781243 RepID=UPI001E2BB628|nr:hypothetical protein [Tenacibaculum finnmarkense]MCD8445638.1 hypothetical protein [Tenacibaculum finnmarkense genomovar ulcerans]MCG8203230.1 hypothetical protein [Tenacibaculum finnmarkense genomovar finnmarkense]MCG8881072.1 hypothetical protein [Tenacibaculum finnmarkense]MCM8865985.1 hypothetical protein [Tenacibaculum finnmarkense genomovar finnmarkense]MCM8888130.1 hypothetical protein [Tenacibaculum finnmarkense genomovar finnmarkense]
MKFAILNNKRIEAKPNLVAECICCGKKVRSYCGKIIIHHWKHIKLSECDKWHESETQWHREWKNKFKKENQEFIMFNSENGEKHIADIHLKNINLTIEFQHSPIEINEIKSRELFYEKLIWIIDLTHHEKNISFNSNIFKAFDKFTDKIISKDFQLHKKIEGKELQLEIIKSEKEFDKIHEYYSEIKNKYFPAYFKYNNKSSSAKIVLKDLIAEKNENPNIKGYSYSDENMTKLKEISELDKTDVHLLMIWKNKHKRWYEAEQPIFFDLGDDYLYRNIENIKSSNGIIVKKYSKEKFVRHYKEQNE